MDSHAIDIQESIDKLAKEARSWNITEALKTRIKIFRDTVPLMQDLNDVAMRDRHWNDLRIELKDEFRERERDFTLEKIMNLDLISHADRISELTNNARKQLQIENKLAQIKETWENDE